MGKNTVQFNIEATMDSEQINAQIKSLTEKVEKLKSSAKGTALFKEEIATLTNILTKVKEYENALASLKNSEKQLQAIRNEPASIGKTTALSMFENKGGIIPTQLKKVEDAYKNVINATNNSTTATKVETAAVKAESVALQANTAAKKENVVVTKQLVNEEGKLANTRLKSLIRQIVPTLTGTTGQAINLESEIAQLNASNPRLAKLLNIKNEGRDSVTGKNAVTTRRKLYAQILNQVSERTQSDLETVINKKMKNTVEVIMQSYNLEGLGSKSAVENMIRQAMAFETGAASPREKTALLSTLSKQGGLTKMAQSLVDFDSYANRLINEISVRKENEVATQLRNALQNTIQATVSASLKESALARNASKFGTNISDRTAYVSKNLAESAKARQSSKFDKLSESYLNAEIKKESDLKTSELISEMTSAYTDKYIATVGAKKQTAANIKERVMQNIYANRAAMLKEDERKAKIAEDKAKAQNDRLLKDSEKVWTEYEKTNSLSAQIKAETERRRAISSMRPQAEVEAEMNATWERKQALWDKVKANIDKSNAIQTGYGAFDKQAKTIESLGAMAQQESELSKVSEHASAMLQRQTTIMNEKERSARKLTATLNNMSISEKEVYLQASKYGNIDPNMAKRYGSYSKGQIGNYGNLSYDATQVALGIGRDMNTGRSNELDIFKGQRSRVFAENLLRDLRTKAEATSQIKLKYGSSYANVYQNALDKILPNILDSQGNIKDNAALENYFKTNDFRRVVMKRLQSNIGGLEANLTKEYSASLVQELQNMATALYKGGVQGTGTEAGRYFLGGATGNIISGRNQQGGLDYYGGTEADWLRNLGRRQTQTAPAAPFMQKMFGVQQVQTFEGAMNNALQRFKQFQEVVPQFLQNINLTYTKAAFAFSRVAYGMRVITMELNMMRQMFTQTFQYALKQVKTYFDFVIKSTETQRKAGMLLEGIFNKDTSKEMIDFARRYAVESPAAFEDIVTMVKGFGLNPAMRKMIETAKERGAMEAQLNELAYVTVGLGMTKSEQGVKGAAFALREAMAGQFISLKRRFEIAPEAVAAAAGKTVQELKKSPQAFMEAMKSFLDLNIGQSTLQKLSFTYQVQMQNIVDFMEQASAMIGESGFYDKAVEMVTKIAESFKLILGTKFFKEQAAEISKQLSNYFDTGYNTVTKLLAKVLPKGDAKKEKERTEQLYNEGIKGGLFGAKLREYVSQGTLSARMFDLISKSLEKMGMIIEKVGTYLEALLDKWFEFANVDDIINTVGMIAKSLAEILNTFASSYFKFVKGVLSSDIGPGFKGIALFFATFPVATANMVVNSLRAMFEVSVMITSLKNWENLMQIGGFMRGLAGSMIQLVTTMASTKAAAEGLQLLSGGLGSTEKVAMVESIQQTNLGKGMSPEASMMNAVTSVAAMENIVLPKWATMASRIAAILRGALGLTLGAAIAANFFDGWDRRLTVWQNSFNGAINLILMSLGLVKAMMEHPFWTIGIAAFVAALLNANILVHTIVSVGWVNAVKQLGTTISTSIAGAMTAITTSTWFWVSALAAAALTLNAIDNYMKRSAIAEKEKRKYAEANTLTEMGIRTPEALKAYQVNRYNASKKLGLRYNDEDMALSAEAFNTVMTVKSELGAEGTNTTAILNRLNAIRDEVTLKYEKSNIIDFMFDFSDKSIIGSAIDRLNNAFIGFKEQFKNTEAGKTISSLMFVPKDGSEDNSTNTANAITENNNKIIASFSEVENKLSEMKNAIKEFYVDGLKSIADMSNNKKLAQSIQDIFYNPELVAAQQLADKYRKREDTDKINEIDKAIAAIKNAKAAYESLPQTVTIPLAIKGADAVLGELNFISKFLDKLNGKSASLFINIMTSFGGFLGGAVGVTGSALTGYMERLGAALGFSKAGSAPKDYDDNIATLMKERGNLAGKGAKEAADKALEQEKRYNQEMSKLNAEILNANHETLRAKIESAEFESTARIKQYEKDFKDYKGYQELMTKVTQAEQAKMRKVIEDEMKSIYETIVNSKWSAPKAIMAAYDKIKAIEIDEKMKNLNYMIEKGWLGAQEASAVKQDYILAQRADRIEKYYETLKNQPSLADLLGGKDAEKVLESFDVRLLKYTGTLSKTLSLTKDVGATTWKLLGTEKVKEGNVTTTIRTSELEGKITGGVGGQTGASMDIMKAMNNLREAYYQNSLTMLTMEIQKERELSELQLSRFADEQKINGLTKEQIRSYRDQIAEIRLLAQAEEQYYKAKEMWIKNTGSLQEQVGFVWSEQIRKLPSQYDVVKSATESMFTTMRDGMSNTLVAAFQGDAQKMKDIWNEFLTSLKNTFLKMLADLVINNVFKSVFGSFLNKDQENIKGNAVNAIASASQNNNTDTTTKTIESAVGAISQGADTFSSILGETSNIEKFAAQDTSYALTELAMAAQQAAMALYDIGSSGGGGMQLLGGDSGSDFGIGSMFGMADDAFDIGNSVLDELFSFGANGGIVSAPTRAVIGEGRVPEALIPMPDGKAVPVELNNKASNAVPIDLTIYNLITDEAINASIERQPNTVLNVVGADIQQNGQTARIIANKRR